MTIDGHDLRRVTLVSLRRQVTLLLQEPILFRTSVFDNIACGSVDDVSLAQVRAAAQKAEAEPFILEMPKGYDTVLAQDGVDLSGGQRQRMGLARALLRETPILVLDEPTSSLDVGTEAVVWKNVEEMLRGRTAIIIAHRLSTARIADRIVVLERGEIVEHRNPRRAAGAPRALPRALDPPQRRQGPARHGLRGLVTRPSGSRLLVVLGMMGRCPFGGQTWLYLNWLRG